MLTSSIPQYTFILVVEEANLPLIFNCAVMGKTVSSSSESLKNVPFGVKNEIDNPFNSS